MEESDAWIAYVDVYGFKAKVRKNSADLTTLIEAIQIAHRQILPRLQDSTKLYALSDSIFLIVRVDAVDVWCAYQQLIADLRILADEFLGQGLPLRGGIAFGPVCSGDGILLGEAIERAVGYEGLVGAPVVILTESEAKRAGLDTRLGPFKSVELLNDTGRLGLHSIMVIKPKSPTRFRRFALNLLRDHLVEGPPHVAYAWKMALELTKETAPKKSIK